MQHPPSSWHVVAPHALSWREWDGEVVVYNDATGSTHHLGPLGGSVLSALHRHPSGIDMASLVRDVSNHAVVAEPAELPAAIEHTLAELAALKLAACIPD